MRPAAPDAISNRPVRFQSSRARFPRARAATCSPAAGPGFLTGARRVPFSGRALQDRFAPNNRCFGCGPANDQGLRIKSFTVGDELRTRWQPEGHHEAFRGMLNGGICGALLDCHLNWTACHHLMQLAGADTPPCTVTAEYKVQLMRPTPTDRPLDLVARVDETPKSDRAWVEGELLADGVVTARCRGLFVALKEGRPAYHRW